MSDLVARAEAGALDPAAFDHATHVELAWRYLQEHPPLETIARMERVIRALAARAGAPDRFHTTITWAYVFAIAERAAELPGAPWSQFAAAHPELFEPGLGLLLRYYQRDRLLCERARHTFLLPLPSHVRRQGPADRHDLGW